MSAAGWLCTAIQEEPGQQTSAWTSGRSATSLLIRVSTRPGTQIIVRSRGRASRGVEEQAGQHVGPMEAEREGK